MAVELYAHNKQTYQNIDAMFEESNRVGVVQPTGTGKSFLYLKWIEDHPNETFAVLSPSTEIFTQLNDYAADCGVSLANVEMISYQTLTHMTDEEIRGIHADKLVLDEFHRTGAEFWGPAVQRLLSVHPDIKVLGASATPVRYLDNSKDMSTELFDRNLAVEMTLGEAVQRNILPTPEYVPVWYDIDGMLAEYQNDIALIQNPEHRKNLEEKLQQLKRRLEDSYGADDIFQKHMPHDHGKFIVFCRNQEHLAEMMETMPKWLAGVNSNIHSYVSISAQEDKDVQLKAFKNDKSDDSVKLLFTIDRLNEGLHVKGIDGVIMLRPTTSPIVYLQQMGRALSVGTEKPLIFDMVNNYQNVQIPLRNGSLVNVFEKEFMDSMEDNHDMSTFRIFEAMAEFSSLFKDLEANLYFSFDQKWDQTFALLEQFVSENNRLPKLREDFNGVKLGKWCMRQKEYSTSSNYPPSRLEKIKSIGLLDSPHETQWDMKFSLLEQFVREFNRFPKKAEVYHDVNLGKWCVAQKSSSKSPDYPSHRFAKLKEIGLLDDTLENRWEQHFSLLKEFIAEHHRMPSQKEVYKGFKLGSWRSSQTQAAQSPDYPKEWLDKLNSVGFFDITLESQWDRKFEILQRFVSENHRLPKADEEYQGVKISAWCKTQKIRSSTPGYPPERIEKLKAIGLFDGVARKDSWDRNFALAEQFYSEYNRFPKNSEEYQGVKLGIWCQNQRTKSKSPDFPPERKEKLQTLGLLEAVTPGRKPSLMDQIAGARQRAKKKPNFGDGFDDSFGQREPVMVKKNKDGSKANDFDGR